MYLTAFFVGATIEATIEAMWYWHKWKRIGKTADIIASDLDEAKADVKSKDEQINELVDKIKQQKEIAFSCGQDFKIDIVDSFFPIKFVTVVMYDTHYNGVDVPIKVYRYNSSDPEDYEFAVRQAEELIEKLREE